MKAKKLALLFLAGTMAASMAACQTAAPEPSAPESAPGAQSAASAASDGGTGGEAPEPITYTFLHCWNGGAFGFPDGWQDGPIAKAVTEKTGVTLNVETITSSETEKIAMVFASGDVPDITNAPFWSTVNGEGEQIKNAGRDGLLLDLNPYYENYPNVKRAMFENVSTAFMQQHLEHPEFNGAHYVIPNKPMSDEDVTNWAYGVHARKDILEALGVDPKSIDSQEKLYDLLVKIKNGNFTDINGKPVIPAGNWHNGWSYEQYTLSTLPGGYTNWDVVDGKPVHEYMTQNTTDGLLFMRKLVSEGLYDPEAFNQTDTMAKEKMATGRVATQGCHWPHQNDFFSSTLYLTNPEMEYVTLGPFKMRDGKNPTSVNRKGAFGFGCLILGADIKDPDRALGVIDYLSGEEGLVLRSFGIEGTHFDYVDGIPTRKEEWQKCLTEDQQRYYLEGFGWANLGVEDNLKARGWDPNYNKPGYVYAREVRPLAFFDGFTLDDVSNEWEGKKEYDEKMSTSVWDDVKKVAITSASDEEALRVLEDYRNKMIAAGYEDMMAYIEQRMAEDSSLIY